MEKEQTSQKFGPCLTNDNQDVTFSFGDTSSSLIPEHFDISSNILSFNSDTNINDVDEESEKAQFRPDDMVVDDRTSGEINLDNSKSTDITQSHSDIQSITTDDINTNKEYMNMYDYSQLLLGKLSLIASELQPVLTNLYTSTIDAERLLVNFQFPHSKMDFQKPLDTLADILKCGYEILLASRQVPSAVLMDEALDEAAEQRGSAHSEQNNDELNKHLHTTTQSNLPTSSVPQDTCLATLSLSLSQLLSQAVRIVQELGLVDLKIVEQPQEFWRKRSINCLKKKWCPAIHGRSRRQRHYIGIKWSDITNCDTNNLFILVQLLTHNDLSHPSKVLIPPETTVKGETSSRKTKKYNIRPTLRDLIIKGTYGYNQSTNTILCPTSAAEFRQQEKNLKVLIFNLYKANEETANSNNGQDSDENEDDEESENEEENNSFEDQVLKLFKLRISLCRRTDTQELECLSNFIDTELIEESKGTESLTIDPSKVTPKYLCECGNETITVTLNTDSEKAGFVVRLNDAELESGQVRGVKDKMITFSSRPSTVPEQNYLNVTVSKKSMMTTIIQNHDPYNGLDENLLLNMKVPYIGHSDNPHVHKEAIAERLI